MSELGNFNFNYNKLVLGPVLNNKSKELIKTNIPSINTQSNVAKDNLTLNKLLQNNSIPSLSFNEENKFIEHKIKRGESLSDVAKKYLGSPNKYMEIFEANKDKLKNPNDLVIGMTIKVPVSSEQFNKFKEINTSKPIETIHTTTNNNVQYKEITVKRGESLGEIALKYLKNSERYMEVFEANRDVLKSPDSLKVGMKLKIPVNDVKPEAPSPSSAIDNNRTVDLGEMNLGAKGIYDALKKYQNYYNKVGNVGRTRTTENEMKLIAVELDKASKAFGVDPKIMLGVFAHESAGFNPRATSHTGAGGLGQLTSIAIRQVHYMAGMAKGQQGRSPYIEYKDNFIKSQTNLSQRHDIKKNIWTATAYMAYEIKDRNNGNIKRALERYGDPNVSTYENKVDHEYKIMFGKSVF
ncbi:MAG: LysM peptidoglycan-binding domain-containing protein [Candidatus Sericytochromatia bacterium]